MNVRLVPAALKTMRQPRTEMRIVGVAVGCVIAHRTGRAWEYLGADGMWMRAPEHAKPFKDEAAARAKADELFEGFRR